MIKKSKRRKVYARFKDNIWTADSAEIGSLSSNNQGVKYAFPNVLTKNAWVNSLNGN